MTSTSSDPHPAPAYIRANRNAAQAAKRFRKSAERGDRRAQFFLGACDVAGRGVEQYFAEAVKWIRLAANRGHEDAKGIMKLIEEPSLEL